MKVLITGSAGFIGFSLALKLIHAGVDVYGIDDINDYYDQGLKYNRLECSGIDSGKIEWGKEVRSNLYPNYCFMRMQLQDKCQLFKIGKAETFDVIVNLAAQAGVRYSITHPETYLQSNVIGFGNVLELAKEINVKHLLYASSSSVYGLNTKMPFSELDAVDHPISLYAATKRSNELMAHVYSHLYNIRTTGLRFFTVYGPWGRPDMACYHFAESILKGYSIDVYNGGLMKRDFTFIDDIVDGICRIIDKTLELGIYTHNVENGTLSGKELYNIYNIGNGKPVSLMDFIILLERYCGKKAKINLMGIQPGDVLETWSDIGRLKKDYGYNPKTSVEEGVEKFISWYLDYKNFYLKVEPVYDTSICYLS